MLELLPDKTSGKSEFRPRQMEDDLVISAKIHMTHLGNRQIKFITPPKKTKSATEDEYSVNSSLRDANSLQNLPTRDDSVRFLVSEADRAAEPEITSSTGLFGTFFPSKSKSLSDADCPNDDVSCMDIETALGKPNVDMSRNHFESNALDVLALYIKGQKLLYTEAKTYCEQQLNFLMLPAIFISCVGSIFSFLSGDYVAGPIIIASLNGFNAFLLSLISYLKLDAKAQAHKTSAYKFDKLESLCEFNSGRFLFFDTKVDDIIDAVDKIESGVREIKETNQFILPESIRYEFAFTYSTNVFMLVKKNQTKEMTDTHKLKNSIEYINKLKPQLKLAKDTGDKDLIQTLEKTIQFEEKQKIRFVRNIMECRRKYFDLDEKFNREIDNHIRRANKWFITRVLCCDWLKS